MRIYRTTGFVEPVDSLNLQRTDGKVTNTVLGGSNTNRSFKGRPYRVDGNLFLQSIRPILLEDLKEKGLAVGNILHTISDDVYHNLHQTPVYADILPDDLYDALFLGAGNGTKFKNPNTGLLVNVHDNVIVSLQIEQENQVDSFPKMGYYRKYTSGYVEKGSGSAYHSERGKIYEKLKEISQRNHPNNNNGKFFCDEAADQMQEYLKGQGLHGARIKFYTWSIGIYHDGAKISEASFHEGVEFEGQIYDNLHPDGVPAEEWISNFDFEGLLEVERDNF